MVEDPRENDEVDRDFQRLTMNLGEHSLVSFQNQVVTMKLDYTNYIVWKQQIIF